ncbi:MAG: hypothetical protein ACJAW1_000706 [Glaciecola sp.]|jgi:hypothetical protein
MPKVLTARQIFTFKNEMYLYLVFTSIFKKKTTRYQQEIQTIYDNVDNLGISV